MKQELTQHQIALEEGYSETFLFSDGHIYCPSYPANLYPIIAVNKQVCPCIITRTIVYRFTTNDGIKGIIIIPFDQEEND